MSRLIDADALKESLEIWEDYDELFVGNIRKHIDDAPTIEPTAQPLDVQEAYYKGKIDAFSECRALFVKSLNEETK